MPKAVAIDNGAPRRRRGAIKVDARSNTRSGSSSRVKTERGLLMRLLLRSPKDTAAAILVFAAVVAIIVNALFLQAGHHPSPMFGVATPMPLPVAMPASVNPLPRPRPNEADAERDGTRVNETDPVDAEDTPLNARPVKVVSISHDSTARQPEAHSSPRSDPLADLIISSRRITGVQRALVKYGYGQLKPTGNAGPETQAAIQKFERDHKLPVTGQISDRLVRELSAATGQAIE